uniref:Protein kinase domain-containing protein n=1 Tax=Oryza rufipogon TaxID=4529 RepID=A0A0E0R8U8_ORYRU
MCKEIDESRKMEFVQELVILCRVNHPNIVKLLGCCLQFEAPMLVYEFVQNKTLQELLDVQRSRRFHVTLGTRLRIAVESAGALAHLHSLSHPILHGDVKPANILLAEGLVAKVSDFGCSTIDENTQAVSKGTPGYIDLDYLLEYQLTAKNDIYSFGVILLELLTGKKPLSKERKCLTSMFQEAMVNGTLCELLDSEIVDESSMSVIYQVAVLASQCLVVPGTTRPVMALVAEELRRLALANEVLRYPQPPLVLEGLSFLNMGSIVSIWYDESKTSGVYSLENNVVFLGWEVIYHNRSIKKQARLGQTDELFLQHGGQLLLEMMKVEGNVGFTLDVREDIKTATSNFEKAHIIGEGGQGTFYTAALNGVDFEAPMLVYEFLQNKTLQELLDLQKSKRFYVILGTRIRIAVESADALVHLHSLPHAIIHGDVKAANILLAEGLVAKVSDFSCLTIDENTQVVLKGTLVYIDPGYLLEYQLTSKNDLLTGQKPLSKDRKSLAWMFQEAMPQGTLFELLDKQCGGPRSSDGGGGERMRSAMAAVVVTRAETDGGSARLWPSPRGSGDDGPPPRRSKGGRPSTMTTMTTTTLTATTTISMMMAQTWRP